jgi:hypothetical protein
VAEAADAEAAGERAQAVALAAAVRALQQAARLRCRDQPRARLGAEQARVRPVARGPEARRARRWVTCQHPAHVRAVLDRAVAPGRVTSPIGPAAVRDPAVAHGPVEARDRVRDLRAVVQRDLGPRAPAQVARLLATSETFSTWAEMEAAPARVDGRAAARWRQVARLQAAPWPAARLLTFCNNVPAARNRAPATWRLILVPAKAAAGSFSPARDRGRAALERSGQQPARVKGAPEPSGQQLDPAKVAVASSSAQATTRGRTVLARAALAHAGIAATRAIGPTIARIASMTAIA